MRKSFPRLLISVLCSLPLPKKHFLAHRETEKRQEERKTFRLASATDFSLSLHEAYKQFFVYIYSGKFESGKTLCVLVKKHFAIGTRFEFFNLNYFHFNKPVTLESLASPFDIVSHLEMMPNRLTVVECMRPSLIKLSFHRWGWCKTSKRWNSRSFHLARKSEKKLKNEWERDDKNRLRWVMNLKFGDWQEWNKKVSLNLYDDARKSWVSSKPSSFNVW